MSVACTTCSGASTTRFCQCVRSTDKREGSQALLDGALNGASAPSCSEARTPTECPRLDGSVRQLPRRTNLLGGALEHRLRGGALVDRRALGEALLEAVRAGVDGAAGGVGKHASGVGAAQVRSVRAASDNGGRGGDAGRVVDDVAAAHQAAGLHDGHGERGREERREDGEERVEREAHCGVICGRVGRSREERVRWL
ncbi:hypothetical protein BD626DRAFT_516137 [Schizophyllum amplum]|uniref:Uncharacterized protein n=1 Tax=Schizophyllum amplum TaxID=97359 RepID=A0A550BXA8_9AGAR|nr:hypothetical protein BD626DRAFT_516137 [Auriculariopsis ampla]